jgi:hypothetical protein
MKTDLPESRQKRIYQKVDKNGFTRKSTKTDLPKSRRKLPEMFLYMRAIGRTRGVSTSDFHGSDKNDVIKNVARSSTLSGVGKLTSPLSTNANVLSATSCSPPPFRPYYDVSMVPAGRERGVTGRALVLAESGDVNLPTAYLVPFG